WNCPYNQPKRTMNEVPFENGGQVVRGRGFRCLSHFGDVVFHSKSNFQRFEQLPSSGRSRPFPHKSRGFPLPIIVALFVGLLWAPAAFAAVIFSTSSGGNFNAGTSWIGPAPGPADDAVIKAGASITVTANANIHSITFSNNSASTATITVNS